jgi:hypothetical protein
MTEQLKIAETFDNKSKHLATQAALGRNLDDLSALVFNMHRTYLVLACLSISLETHICCNT